jgi:hypothetical protein
MNKQEKIEALKELARQYPQHVGTMWKNPLNPRNTILNFICNFID